MTNLTTTLEMSKKLKEYGWSKETRFYRDHRDVECQARSQFEPLDSWLPAPTITELLEEMDNNVILQYENDMQVGLPIGDFIDLFRSPDKLADVYIFAKKEGLIK